jgi:hypothetical protein
MFLHYSIVELTDEDEPVFVLELPALLSLLQL